VDKTISAVRGVSCPTDWAKYGRRGNVVQVSFAPAEYLSNAPKVKVVAIYPSVKVIVVCPFMRMRCHSLCLT
jgi:hypothetical protein